MSALEMHRAWFWVATLATGAVGVWGLGIHLMRRQPGRLFAWARGGAIAAMLVQVGLGLILYAQDLRPDAIHVFYGFLILFALSFAYIYRPTLARRPALAYGLLLLFVMGLGLRAYSNVG